MVNASNPPADEIALVLGPSSPVNFGGGAWPGSVSSNGGTMVGIEFYSGTVNGYSGPALFIYTSQGLVIWTPINAVPKPWQAFTLEVGVTSDETPPLFNQKLNTLSILAGVYSVSDNVCIGSVDIKNSTRRPNPRRLRDFLICRRKKRVTLKEA